MWQNADNKTPGLSNITIWLTLLAFLISGIFLIIIWAYPNPGYTGDGSFYLLSSISQGMAATFAILFTLLMLEVQISSKYSSYLIKSICGTRTVVYMFLFIIAIIMPLICLRYMHKHFLEFSFAFAVLCLLLIVPFLRSVKDKFNPTNLINENRSSAVKAIEKKGFLNKSKKVVRYIFSKIGVPNKPKKEVESIFGKIKAISGIARISMLEEDYLVYAEGVEALGKIEFKYIKYGSNISNGVEDCYKEPKEQGRIHLGRIFWMRKLSYQSCFLM